MRFSFLFVAALAMLAAPASGQPLSSTEQAQVDAIVTEVLAASEVSSASIAVVRQGAIAYAHAYGLADRERGVAASIDTQYAIGSITKQFTATAALMLVERGQLTLDGSVAWFDPNLTGASEITLRHLLTHTSGYPDFWPQDYPFPQMRRDVEPRDVLRRWAHGPLEFAPGSQFRYSNTGYTLAALMVESASQQSLHAFEQENIFGPLGMTGASRLNTEAGINSVGYSRYGLGAPAPARREGEGWLLGAGDLAMRASDLAVWNISLMQGGLLNPALFAEMTSGSSTAEYYGFGLTLQNENGKRVWSHVGGVTGYTAANYIYPDEGLAITVLTNGDFGAGAVTILPRLAMLLREQPSNVERVRRQIAAFQTGSIDRALFTANANDYYDDVALATMSVSLAPLGQVRGIAVLENGARGGFTDEVYRVVFARRTGVAVVRVEPDTGLIEEFNLYFGAS